MTEARRPDYYTAGGVPDTPEGRFEMIAAVQSLVLIRLAAEGEAGQRLGQALNEAFVRDMDDSVREMGIGDMGVAKRVKKAAAALYDRHGAYGRALASADPEALCGAVARHVWGTDAATAGMHRQKADYIAAALLRLAGTLAGERGDRLLGGEWRLPTTTGPVSQEGRQ